MDQDQDVSLNVIHDVCLSDVNDKIVVTLTSFSGDNDESLCGDNVVGKNVMGENVVGQNVVWTMLCGQCPVDNVVDNVVWTMLCEQCCVNNVV